MKKFRLIFLVLAIVMVPMIGAQAQAAKPSGTIRVSAWESAEALEPYQKALEAFKKSNPEIEVKLESIPQDYGTKILAQFAAGDAPDVFQIGDGDVATWVGLGAVEQLDSYLTGDSPLDMGVFFPGVASFGKVGDKLYFLTKDYSPLVLFYNKKFFKEAGLAEPTDKWTWDDLLNAAKVLTVDTNGNNATSDKFDPKNIARWGIQMPDSWGDPLWVRGILPIIYQGGGKLISDDGKTTTGFMNSEKTVAALQWYVDMFKKHHVAIDKEQYAAFSGANLWQGGQVAMLWSGRWGLKDDLALKDFEFGTVGLPAGPAGKANALCWAGFGIYSGSKNKAAAWEWLKHVSAGEGAKEFANYAFTAVKPIADAQGLSKDPYNAPIIADLDNVKPLPEFTTGNWNQCGNKFFQENLEKIFLQDTPVQQAMDEAAKASDECLAKAK